MRKTWRQRSILLVLGLIGAIVILEVGLRIVGMNDPVLYVADPELGFRIKPDQQVAYIGNEIVINRFGVRDARPFDSKPPDKTRILVLGDSVTWGGVRIPQPYLFTSVLERELGDAEVINAGVNGYSVWRMAALYREHLRELNPDIVLLVVIPGDFLRPPVVDLVQSSPAFPLKRPTIALAAGLASARILLAGKFDWDWAMPPRPDRPREDWTEDECLQQNLDAIRELKRALSAHQELVIAVAPHRGGSEDPLIPESVKKLIDGERIQTLHLGDERIWKPEYFMDHVHLNSAGHAKVGQHLAEWLRGLEANR